MISNNILLYTITSSDAAFGSRTRRAGSDSGVARKAACPSGCEVQAWLRPIPLVFVLCPAEVFINRQLIYNYPEQLFKDAGVMAIEHSDFEGPLPNDTMIYCVILYDIVLRHMF